MARDRILQIYRGTTAQNDAFTGAQGELTMDTARKEIRIHDGSTAGGNVVGLTPGFIAPFAGSTAPAGWLVCDGSAVSRTTYAKLFAVIGTTYGSGDGNTTFNLPNQSPTRKVIKYQTPTANNDWKWYRLYDDGWVEQGGLKPETSVNSTVYLPITMANTNYTLLTTVNHNVTNYASPVCNLYTDRFTTFQDFAVFWRVSGISSQGTTQQNVICIKY